MSGNWRSSNELIYCYSKKLPQLSYHDLPIICRTNQQRNESNKAKLHSNLSFCFRLLKELKKALAEANRLSYNKGWMRRAQSLTEMTAFDDAAHAYGKYLDNDVNNEILPPDKRQYYPKSFTETMITTRCPFSSISGI
jgi:tetratricopeptide (TPR) repeat protein